MIAIVFIIVAMGMFIHSAGFQAWVFWHLFRHQELLLYEYSRFFNVAEFALAVAILVMAIVAFGFTIGFIHGLMEKKR